jgi:peptide deformylase
MTSYQIRQIGDPVLREACRDVEVFDENLQSLAKDMTEAMYAAPGVGLAANQVGLSLRLFVYDAGEGSGPGAIANPVVTLLGGEQNEEEGCLSISGVYRPTVRALHARVDGVDLSGEPVSIEAEGLLARIFQHETDHLNGTLYIDRLSEEDRRSALAEYRDLELNAVRPRSQPAPPTE